MELTINSFSDLVGLIADLIVAGYLKDVKNSDVVAAFANASYPIRIPIDLKGFTKVIGNPIVRKTGGKQIESKIMEIWKMAEEAGH